MRGKLNRVRGSGRDASHGQVGALGVSQMGSVAVGLGKATGADVRDDY